MKNYNVVEVKFDEFYEGGTKPEGRIFTFSRRVNDCPLNSLWKIAHWEEVLGLLVEKYLFSEKGRQNCGLVTAARSYFGNEECIKDLYGLTREFELSLPELSLVIKERGRSRIFIPNLSISNANAGKFIQHQTLDAFFSSDSYLLLKYLSQYAAANPDFSLSCEEQNKKFIEWVSENAQEASELLKKSTKIHSGKMFVEGVSPDIVLRRLGHRPYEEIAQEVVLRKGLEATLV